MIGCGVVGQIEGPPRNSWRSLLDVGSCLSSCKASNERGGKEEEEEEEEEKGPVAKLTTTADAAPGRLDLDLTSTALWVRNVFIS